MKKAILGIVALGLSILVVYTSLNSGATYANAAGVIGPWINDHFFFGRLSHDEVRALMGFGSKFIGHFCLFVLTGLFSYLFFVASLKRRTAWILFFVYGAFLSSLGEIIQLFIAGRSPTVVDVFVNYGGYVLLPMIHGFYRSINPRPSR